MNFVCIVTFMRDLFRIKKNGVDIRITCSTNVCYQVVANHDGLVIFYAMTVKRKIENFAGWFSVTSAL